MQNFPETIKELNSISENLEKENLISLASKLTDLNKNLLNIKTAQHLGVQGYWIKNTRCWQNCYKQKRAKTSTPSQKIWEECQEEYSKSLQGKNEEWEKYAEKEDDKIVLSNKDSLNKIAQKTNEYLKEKLASSNNVKEDFEKTMEKFAEEYNKKYIKACNDIIDFSFELFKSDKIEESVKVAQIGDSLIKESQFGGWMGNMYNKGRNFVSNKVRGQNNPVVKLRWLDSFSKAIYGQYDSLKQFSNSRDPRDYAKYNQGMLALQNSVKNKMTEFDIAIGRDYPSSQTLFNLLNAFSTKKLDSGRGKLLINKIFPIVEKLKNEINTSDKVPATQKEQPQVAVEQKKEVSNQNELNPKEVDLLKKVVSNPSWFKSLNSLLKNFQITPALKRTSNVFSLTKQAQFGQYVEDQNKNNQNQQMMMIKQLANKLDSLYTENRLSVERVASELGLFLYQGTQVDENQSLQGGTPFNGFSSSGVEGTSSIGGTPQNKVAPQATTPGVFSPFRENQLGMDRTPINRGISGNSMTNRGQ